MEEVNSRPHVLLPLQTFLDTQTKFIESSIPELKQSGSGVNLNNVKQFDELLTHLETSFAANFESSYDSQYSYTNLRIPSVDILRVIFTLASRCPSSNWTDNTTSIDGLQTTNEQVRALNEDYFNSIHKPPLQNRSIWLLKTYFSIISHQINSEDPIIKLLYERIIEVLQDFIVRNRSVIRSPVRNSNPTIRISKKSPITPSKGDILSYFSSSPTERKSVTRTTTPIKKEQENKQDEQISDSEETISDLNNEIIGAIDMERELSKFQSYNMSPPKPLSRNLLPTGENSTTSEALLNSISKDNTKSNNRNRDNTLSPSVFPNWHTIRVFDDNILSMKLNPRLNRQFNLWQLVNWTFYCAQRSTELQRQTPNSNYSSFHIIYTAHRDIIDMIFDVLSLNFHRIIETATWVQKFKGSNTLPKMVDESDEILFSKLMTQLGASQRDWYDRAIEYVFNGLGSRSKEPPRSCYDREKGLITHDHSMKEKFQNYNFGDLYESNDNYNSMKSRFKICCQLYYWSTFFSDINESTLFEPLSKRELLTQLEFKFTAIDYHYLIKFYCSFKSVDSIVPIDIRHSFLEELSNVLILEITKTVEEDAFIIGNEGGGQIDNILKFLNAINDEYIWSAVVEDETYTSYESFIQQWIKVNFLFEWLINEAFEKYSVIITSNSLSSRQVYTSLSAVHIKCKEVDKFRIHLFEKFLNYHHTNQENLILSKQQIDIEKKKVYINKFQDIFSNWFHKYFEAID
ncbi:uncharacterized protein RJT21DRAFT_10266 [Scheffersomyces amazonensis]|uniref:uncharacterized protein n=1 Tax=Scheffersomyces amazonensis TaxID=1078765 RepID=UPI00315DDD71